eukprot:TRINITY_DN10694_c0_g1_i8.p1 TRINITY_DN10694_c0_g1~~TRINITY_DN10694_c0_g1_i8.p1  ORF type:complete len:281 (+),score=83.41 TRINITY_DN10694_c0_g1_i8:124-966(+)
MIRRPPRSTLSSSSAASDVYKRQGINAEYGGQGRGAMSACPPVDQCKATMERLRKKSQQIIDRLTSFAKADVVVGKDCPLNLPMEESKLENFLSEMEMQWRHHGLLTRTMLVEPSQRLDKNSAHVDTLQDAVDEAKKDSVMFSNVIKALTKDKNRAVMYAMEKYNLWQGGTTEDNADSQAGAIWAQTFALQDEAADDLDEILQMADDQNQQGAESLQTMKEQTEMYKENIESAKEVTELFKEGLARLAKLTDTASKDPLGTGMCVLCCIIVVLCVYVTMK